MYKFNSSRLKVFKYNVEVNFEDAARFGEVVALADSQALRSIRDIRKRVVVPSKLERLYAERDELKKRRGDNADRIEYLQSRINRTLFVPDYVTVVMEHKAHYRQLFNQGFVLNGKKYVRFSCSAGQGRSSTVTFCCEEIVGELRRRIDNGRDMSKPIAPNKLNAYFGLATSATQVVSAPRIAVVKDFKNYVSFMANYVTETDWDADDEIVQKVIQDVEMNRTDGMALISPEKATQWAEELGLDYTPSQFCFRQSFMKGMACIFPIHQFCEEKNGGNYIVDTVYQDENGEYIKADLRECDMVISESQFKLWDSYPNIDAYLNSCRKNNLKWGVTQYAPKEAKDILRLNYQFIQTLDLDEAAVRRLASQFVDWMCGVSYDNVPYLLLFLMGVNHNEETLRRFVNSGRNYWLKSLVVNPDIRHDKFIRSKIREYMTNKISSACMGDIFVDGNFQVLVSDPYGFMQHVCGQEVTGLLREGEYYSNYWNERGASTVDGMRSPLTYRSEHVVLNLRDDEEVRKWYRYCTLGIIINYHGHEVVNWAGADKILSCV